MVTKQNAGKYSTIQVPRTERIIEDAKELASLMQREMPSGVKVPIYSAIKFALTETLKARKGKG